MSAAPRLSKPDLDDFGYVRAPDAPRYRRVHVSEKVGHVYRQIAMLEETRRQNEALERIATALEAIARGCGT